MPSPTRPSGPVLFAFSGRSGSGKSLLAQALARALGAAYLRIDRIEQALKDVPGASPEIGEAGYRVAYALAADQLRMGLSVVADSVNPLAATRRGWHAVAQGAAASVLDIEVRCSDEAEHRRRVASRSADIEGLHMPSWDELRSRRYDAWEDATRIVVDTAGLDSSTRLNPCRLSQVFLRGNVGLVAP